MATISPEVLFWIDFIQFKKHFNRVVMPRSLQLFNHRLDHAVYWGREFMRAELALVTGQDYVQD